MRTQRSSPLNSPQPPASLQRPKSSSTAGRRFWSVFDDDYIALEGAHRVQRTVNGRKQSATVTVACITASNTATTVPLDKSEVRVDTYRATGPGGQHRNKTNSAVRLTHRPTGTVVTATESRSQRENRDTAWRRLRESLQSLERREAQHQVNHQRQEALAEHRTFVWTSWRDEVRTPDGRKVSMSRALKGKLAPLLR